MNYQYKNPQVLFEGKRIDVLSVEVFSSSGKSYKQEVVDHPGAVVILPIVDNESLLLIRNERPIVQEFLWELPAGTLEEGEDPWACASRELIEESGYKADKFSTLLHCFSTPGFCNEKLHIFLAEELHHVGQNLDETENILVEHFSFSQALQMIKEGAIHDAKTICALLFFETYCRSQ